MSKKGMNLTIIIPILVAIIFLVAFLVLLAIQKGMLAEGSSYLKDLFKFS